MTATLRRQRFYHVSVVLPTGVVMVVGGVDSGGAETSAELYDPIARSWRSAASLSIGRDGGHTATLLRSGAVLVVGGAEQAQYRSGRPELYDPVSGGWQLAAVAMGRKDHTATALPSGQVLVAGGVHGDATLASAQIFDPTGHDRRAAPGSGPVPAIRSRKSC